MLIYFDIVKLGELWIITNKPLSTVLKGEKQIKRTLGQKINCSPHSPGEKNYPLTSKTNLVKLIKTEYNIPNTQFRSASIARGTNKSKFINSLSENVKKNCYTKF